MEVCVDGSVVDGDEVADSGGLLEGDAHGCFGAHAVADEGGFVEGVGGEEVRYIGCERGVCMDWIVR